MKRTINSIVIVAAAALMLSSCVNTQKGFQSSPVISRNVQLDPIRADIEVNEDKKLKGESSASYLFGIRISGDRTFMDGITYSSDASKTGFARYNPLYLLNQGRLAKVRAAAAYKALDGKAYDFLVHPNYSVRTENYLVFRKYRVTVDGYGAKYKNFRTERQKVVITNRSQEYVFPDED